MAELPEKIKAILALEQRQGYLESSVMGGFSGWLAELSHSVKPSAAAAELSVLAGEYAGASLIKRPQLLARIAAVLVKCDWPEDTVRPHHSPAVAGQLGVSIEYMKGVGPKRAALLRKLGVYTVRDLLFLPPRTYESRPEPVPFAQAQEGEEAVLCGKILSHTLLRPNRRLTILKVLLTDGTDTICAVWYNQPHLQEKMSAGESIVVFGKLERRFSGRELNVQDYEFAERPGDNGYLPVYPLTANLTQKSMRRLLETAWGRYAQYLTEELPPDILLPLGLLPLPQALYQIHFPKDAQEAEQGRRRLAYQELLVTQLTVLASRLPENSDFPPRRSTPDAAELLNEFSKELPFTLTGAQQRVIGEVFADMDAAKPMRRLVQGDVGSGKTMIAAAALYKNHLAGRQGALMAPTEILAEQHFGNLHKLLVQLGMSVALLTGSTPAAERRDILMRLNAGTLDVLVGTHALFSGDVVFADLGLAVTDEQHRFGVNQRNALRKKGAAADVLVLTATPIPRTLYMTFCGDLDVSVLDELPPGRKPIQTFAVGYDLEDRAFNFVRGQIEAGRQAYVVCPLVEESDKLALDSAVKLTERLQTEVFPSCQVAMLYGKMKSQEKEQIMQRFAAGEVQVLVSTTVIEVGVDVPNATVMLVRDAERFGLSQLHQLRGRVGRGAEQSYCLLLNNATGPVARERLRTLTETNDGFVIAEADLRLRGAGEILGTRQSGLAELKYADLARDMRLVEAARQDALRLLASGEYLDWPLSAEVRRKSELLES